MTEIIAELCQNHNGDIKIVEEMVHAAAESGADYAKIQSMKSSELTHRLRFDEGLIEGGKTKVIKRPYKNEFERLSKLDLSEDDHSKFLDMCKKYKIKPMTTIFSYSNIDLVEKLGFKKVKISSFDCASTGLLKEIVKRSFESIIISTGATFNREINQASQILKDSGKEYSMLHCVSIYPTPIEHAHLSRMNYLKKFSKKVGLSDHSNPEESGNIIPAAAIYLGAELIEKHFTILPKDKTKDGPVSVNPLQLKEIVSMKNMPNKELKNIIDLKIKDHEVILGMENRDLSDIELLNRDYYQGRFASKKNNGDYHFNWD